jgi:hypothetical protein
MRKSLSIIAVFVLLIMVIHHIPYSTVGQTMTAPTWHPNDEWRYNITIEGNPNQGTSTIHVSGAGSYYDDNNTEYKIYDVDYITNILEDSEDFGHVYTRTVENRKITRYPDYETAFSNSTIYVYYDHGRENQTIRKTIKYSTFIDSYNFPIEEEESWFQISVVNTSTAIYSGATTGTPSEEDKNDEYYLNETKNYYFTCTGKVDLSVTLADDPLYYMPNSSSNWTTRIFTTLRIVQDNEEVDSDGNLSVVYYNESVGNMVKRVTFIQGNLDTSETLVYYQYIHTDTIGGDLDWEEEEDETIQINPIILYIILFTALFITIFIIIYLIRRKH